MHYPFPEVDTMFLLQLLAAIFIFVIFVSGKSHENEIEISGVYIMDKVEGDLQGYFTEHLKSLHQHMTYTNDVIASKYSMLTLLKVSVINSILF